MDLPLYSSPPLDARPTGGDAVPTNETNDVRALIQSDWVQRDEPPPSPPIVDEVQSEEGPPNGNISRAPSVPAHSVDDPNPVEFDGGPSGPSVGVPLTRTNASAITQDRRPPPEVIDRFEAFFRATADNTEVALYAIFRDGYANWIDTFGNTGRIRPTDAADAANRVSAALHSVIADARAGRLSPQDFGVQRWRDVDGSALMDKAKERLQSNRFDVDAAVTRMQADPLWTNDPIHVPTEEGQHALDDSQTGGFFDRSVVSLSAPNWLAVQFAESDLGQTIVEQSNRVAQAPTSRRELAAAESRLGVAHALYEGTSIPPNSHAALPAILDVTGISPFADVSRAPPSATQQSLEREVRREEIDGFQPIDGGFLTFRLKSPQQIGREVVARDEVGMLEHLSPEARAQLMDLVGPRHAPGQAIADRLESENRWSGYRQFGSEVITLAAVGVASGGVGAMAEGFAVGARASAAGIRAARFLATSAAFTTLMGASRGELSATDYGRDALMLGVLGRAARLGPVVARMIPGSGMPARLTRLATAHGVAVGTTAGTLTVANAIERGIRTGDPQLDRLGSDLLHNLAVVSVLHGTNLAFARIRPELAAGAATQQELAVLEQRHADNIVRTERAVQSIERALETGDITALERGQRELAEARTSALETRSDLSDFAHRSVSPEVGRAVDEVMDIADLQVNGRVVEMTPRAQRLRALAREIGAEEVRRLTGQLGPEGVEALVARVPTDIVQALAREPTLNAAALQTLVNVPMDDQPHLVRALRGPDGNTRTADQTVQLLRRSNARRFIEAGVHRERTQGANQAAAAQRYQDARTQLQGSGFLEQPRVQEAIRRGDADALRGLIGEEIGRLEASRAYPAADGHRVTTGLHVLESAPGQEGQPNTRTLNGQTFRERGELDVVVSQRQEGRPDAVRYLEQDKTGRNDAPNQASGQTDKALQAIQRHLEGQSEVRLLDDNSVDVTDQYDLSSFSGAQRRTRGPVPKGFDLDMWGLSAQQLDALAREFVGTD